MNAPARAVPALSTPAPPPAPTDRLRRGAADFWVWLLVWHAEHLPRLARALRPVMVFFAWHCSRSMRAGTLANARWLLGESSTPRQRAALGRTVVDHFYGFIHELGRNRGRRRADLLADVAGVEGSERYRAARALGQGAIVVTAHLGSFETGVMALRGMEEKVHVVFRRDRMARFEAVRSDQHRRLGVIEAPVDDEGGWAVWVRLRDALRADEVVLMQGDRVMPGQKGVRVPFLGGHIEVPAGPIKLALASGAPIVPIFSVREPGRPSRIRVFVEEPITVQPGPSDPQTPHPALLQLAAVIERYVSRYPDQWLMVQPVWCEDGAGSSRGCGERPGSGS